MKFIRPHDATEASYKFKCSECGAICHQVTGHGRSKDKGKKAICTYLYCPYCGEKVDKEPYELVAAEALEKMRAIEEIIKRATKTDLHYGCLKLTFKRISEIVLDPVLKDEDMEDDLQ